MTDAPVRLLNGFTGPPDTGGRRSGHARVDLSVPRADAERMAREAVSPLGVR
jgi:hypothetical protein